MIILFFFLFRTQRNRLGKRFHIGIYLCYDNYNNKLYTVPNDRAAVFFFFPLRFRSPDVRGRRGGNQNKFVSSCCYIIATRHRSRVLSATAEYPTDYLGALHVLYRSFSRIGYAVRKRFF